MDHRLVEMPGPDGSPGFAIVEASAADDPAKLQELRENHRHFVTEQQASTTNWTASPAPAA
jgi:hypothetical protein